jgi:hypothetical protein
VIKNQKNIFRFSLNECFFLLLEMEMMSFSRANQLDVRHSNQSLAQSIKCVVPDKTEAGTWGAVAPFQEDGNWEKRLVRSPWSAP